jgi:hypothetical protein
VQHLLVVGLPVEHAAMLEELLPVVGGHDDERVLESTLLAQLREQALERAIELPDFRS